MGTVEADSEVDAFLLPVLPDTFGLFLHPSLGPSSAHVVAATLVPEDYLNRTWVV